MCICIGVLLHPYSDSKDFKTNGPEEHTTGASSLLHLNALQTVVNNNKAKIVFLIK
jgi:hypothetical protein